MKESFSLMEQWIICKQNAHRRAGNVETGLQGGHYLLRGSIDLPCDRLSHHIRQLEGVILQLWSAHSVHADHQQRSPHRRSHQGGPYSQFNFQISIHILSSQERHKLFVPWMITTAMFLYLMGYSSIVLLAMGDWVIVMFFAAPVIGCLGMAFYAVQKAFCRMRKDGMPPKYADMQVKSILVNPI
ncbi:uncharacterized protein Dsimw501_GD15357, isoform B [Drosophila simulans]|uniref:Uncharacterized protein, isoform B n=1 Tax=Drosophila simulans TaxID=7240 RepID=A0A0J9R7H0_DROSI|nr:uncharacterized protein Dsimw501_GD15357, isoform B [Drosophila simulans]